MDRIRRNQSLSLGLVLLLGLALSLLGFGAVDHWQAHQVHDAVETRFQQQAQDRIAAIHREVEAHLLAARSLAALYAASRDVTRQEFDRFAGTLLNSIPSLQALEWIPEVTDVERTDFEAERRATSDGQSFRITERDRNGQLVPAAVRACYYPVDYVVPLSGNAIARGFDLASEAVRGEAIERARDSGKAAVSGPIALVQERSTASIESQSAFLIFEPIYHPQPATETLDRGQRTGALAGRGSQLLGFVVAVSRIGDLVESALASLSDQAIGLRLFDVSGGAEGIPLYHHSAYYHGPMASQRPVTTPPPFSYSKQWTIAGRQWRIVATPGSEFTQSPAGTNSWWVLVAGLLLTLLLTAYVRALQQHSNRLRQRSRREQMLSHCNHSLARTITEQDLLDAFCRIMVQIGGYRLARIDYHPPMSVNNPVAIAVVDGTTPAMDPGKTSHPVPIDRGRHLARPRTGTRYWLSRLLRRRECPAIVLPLHANEGLIGTLSLQAIGNHPSVVKEQTLLADIAAGLAFGIETRRGRVAEQQQLRRLREDIEQEERGQLAAILHDGVGQSVQAINLGLKRLRSEPGAATDGRLLNTLIDEAADIIDEFRTISHELRPLSMGNRGLGEAMQQHCKALDERSHIPIRCHIVADVDDLSARAQEQCFLAFREALGNALRHSDAGNISVTLGWSDDHSLQLMVSDNGTGFDPDGDFAHPSGLGLSMIKERSKSIGGHANIRSSISDGTTVIITLPMDPDSTLPASRSTPQNKSKSATDPRMDRSALSA